MSFIFSIIAFSSKFGSEKNFTERNFPNSLNAPKYLHNRARILEDKVQNNKAARLAYEELIELYPEHSLSLNSKIYLEKVFEKSDAEILNLIQKD